MKLLTGVSAAALALVSAAASAQETGAAGTVPNMDAPADAPQPDIVVSGIRASLASAQAKKENSNEIVDSVVAEDIGKLPDVTASESLARIPGVQVTRNAGIAQGVTVRGLVDLATTYKGREVFTAEGRFVQLQDFPANGIARIDVYKSSSANLLEPGLAGLIDVRSRQPFDFKKTTLIGAVNGVHWYQSQNLGIEANGLFSTRWDTGIGEMGFLIEGSYADTKFTDSSRVNAQDIRNRTNVPGIAQLRYPNFVNTDYGTGIRYRPNAAAAFQWRPSAALEIYLDGLFQGYRAKNGNRNMQVVASDTATLSNVTLFPGTNQAASFDAAAGTGPAPSGAQNINDQWTDTYQAGGGFILTDGPARLTGDVAFTDSTFTNYNVAFNYALTSAPGRHFEFDAPQGVGGGAVTLLNYDLFNANNYRWTGLTQTAARGHGRSWQGRLDAEYKLDRFGLSELQAGVRYSRRTAESYNNVQAVNAPGGQLYSLLPLQYQSAPRGFRNDDVPSLRSWLTPTVDSLDANLDGLRGRLGIAPGRLDFGTPIFESNEDIYSAYLQARYAFDLGIPIDGQVGLRATRADAEVSGLRRSTTNGVTTVTPISSSSRDTDYLPNVSLRAHLTRELQLRLAFTQTRTRPGFGQLNPTVTIGALPTICTTDPNSTDCVRSASSGNPDLQPIRSNNYDASLEWYFSRSGSFTVGAFRKDLNGFINTFVTDVPDAQFGRLRLNRPDNGGRGRVDGVEAGFRTFLRAPWLPNWLSNVGGLVNYTYLDATSELAPNLAATLAGQQRIAGTSKHTYNLSAFYDTPELSARLSYNYRSNFIVGYGQVADPALGAGVIGPTLPIIENGRGTMDFAATLTPTPNITFTFNVNNLLGAAAQNRRQFNTLGQSYIFQTRFLESVYRVGVRFRL
ncbi:TonB-dependent receptor [uncultured Sphingomonas sp.]|uniref:TonB-dependent receptor n=1 Tax=uncultured Sphingomonas sp. TaxID=158754 RepID=UPI0025FD2492|nr:TonB-dependent receptor [uncultured Sphingomonas sp.]